MTLPPPSALHSFRYCRSISLKFAPTTILILNQIQKSVQQSFKPADFTAIYRVDTGLAREAKSADLDAGLAQRRVWRAIKFSSNPALQFRI